MKSPLHILHLEDEPNDAELIQSVLETEGIVSAIPCVQTRDNFVRVLELGGIDLIFLDFDLPAFDGLSAAEIVQAPVVHDTLHPRFRVAWRRNDH